ncbi:MAG: hydrogenase maturation nickel metallochaperone HypA [archaeon]|nr:hydrogenase maturation nickel metallochaperone HypA [archaeon]
MHEMALVNNIYVTCKRTAEQHKAKKIVEIFLELGDFALVVEDLLQRSFDIISHSDPISKGAKLKMKRTPGILSCKDCKKEMEIWFNKEKEKEQDNEESLKAMGKYEESVAQISNVNSYQNLGVNLFTCRLCGSKNTELTGGKEIKIVNIRVAD